MAFCKKCGNPLGETDKFCGLCGTTTEEPAQAIVITEDPIPVVAQPAVPVLSAKTKVLGFVGMGISIFGLFFGAIGFLYALIGLMEDPSLAFGMSVGFGMFALPLSIVGRILSNRSRNAGNFSGSCSAGAGLGLAGIIVSAVLLFVGFICLVTAF